MGTQSRPPLLDSNVNPHSNPLGAVGTDNSGVRPRTFTLFDPATGHPVVPPDASHAKPLPLPDMGSGGLPECAAPASPPGLVLLQTSQKSLSFSPLKSRLKQMHRAVVGTAGEIEEFMQGKKIRYRAAFITATYDPKGEGWHKRDISGLTDRYRKWAKSQGIEIMGVWVLEQQKSGNPHYHLVLFIPRGYTPPMPDKQGWWTKGSTNCTWARKPVWYISKYASKCDPVNLLPKGARLHGHIGLNPTVWARRAWWLTPQWLKDMIPQSHGVKRVEGWWRDLTTGIEYRSPWVLDNFRGGMISIFWFGWEEGENYRFT